LPFSTLHYEKITLGIMLLFGGSLMCQGQVIKAVGDTTTLGQDLRDAFSTLDPGRTSTRILMDQVPVVSNPHSFNGQARTTANTCQNWLQQYWEYYQASFDRARLSDVPTLQKRIQARTETGNTALLILNYDYDELKSEAVAKGSITIDSVAGRLYDGPNWGASPYQQQHLFAAALAGDIPANGVTTMWVGSEFWLGTGPIPAAVTIDFGDGLGPRFVEMNSAVELHYPVNEMRNSIRSENPTEQVVSANSPTIWITYGKNGGQAWAKASTTTALAVLPDVALGIRASHAYLKFASSYGGGLGKMGRRQHHR
jgi:hypothetical protein